MPNTILIVDDEAGIRDALSSVLKDEGYTVESVPTGEECLSRLILFGEGALRRALQSQAPIRCGS